MAGVRAFFALEAPDSVKDQLVSSRRSLVDELPSARWVKAENQHLTIKFLGETPSDVLAGLAARLRCEVKGTGTVTISLDRGGFFPNTRRPRVAWLGGAAAGVAPLADAVERSSAEFGLARAKKPWSLHLTQARLKAPWPRWAVDRFLEWGERMELPVIECSELVLFASELRPEGAVYTALERFTLL